MPIGDNITLVLDYKDSATGQSISNLSGYIHISLVSLNATGVGPFEYWLETGPGGEFIYKINSTPYWATGSFYFEVNVTWAMGELPLYNNVTGTIVRAVIRGINTQTFANAPEPGTVPIGDDVSVVVTYYDLDRITNIQGATIISDWLYGWEFVEL